MSKPLEEALLVILEELKKIEEAANQFGGYKTTMYSVALIEKIVRDLLWRSPVD